MSSCLEKEMLFFHYLMPDIRRLHIEMKKILDVPASKSHDPSAVAFFVFVMV